MATVNNATGVYTTLGYNFSDPNGDVQTLSANTQAHLNTMPAFISTWQAQDIANNAVGGYFQNPTSNSVNNIITLSNQIYILANSIAGNANSTFTGTANLYPLIPAANTLYSTASVFLAHTNRLSGVTPYTGNDQTNPYYSNAMNFGKTALYITNQTDSITNTSPILGSFTSILVAPQVSANSNTITSDYATFVAGINNNTLSNTQVTQIVSDLTNTNSFLSTRQNGDVTYFTNLQTFVNNYNTLKQFSNMGETQNYLCNNFIGTPKLVSRINS